MSVNFAKLSPFQVDPEKIEALNLTADDFDVASSEEKESVVYKHKSVSYWRDAARRFRANTVSMVALFVFILCLLFAFLGPKLIPYNYSDQYRSSQKLSSMQYSEEEQKIIALFVVGAIGVIGGYLLSYGLPLNKRIWSPSYVLMTCGLASLLQALLMYIIDIQQKSGLSKYSAGVQPYFSRMPSCSLTLSDRCRCRGRRRSSARSAISRR